jgi:hypothetical protein
VPEAFRTNEPHPLIDAEKRRGLLVQEWGARAVFKNDPDARRFRPQHARVRPQRVVAWVERAD